MHKTRRNGRVRWRVELAIDVRGPLTSRQVCDLIWKAHRVVLKPGYVGYLLTKMVACGKYVRHGKLLVGTAEQINEYKRRNAKKPYHRRDPKITARAALDDMKQREWEEIFG